MNMPKAKLSVALGALVCFASGCADAGLYEEAGQVESTSEQSVTIVPEFTIRGTETLPDALYLSKLGLVISEVRLEPVTTDLNAVAYSSRVPSVIEFDVARGQTTRAGAELILPQGGRYLVGVRLEPEDISKVDSSSFTVAGFVASDGIARVDPRVSDGKEADGSPIPLPYDERDEEEPDELQDSPALPTQWTPFYYESRRSQYFPLGDIVLEPGRQTLTVRFDVQDWALELVDPILNAVRYNGDASVDQNDGVDVSTPVDSTGRGADGLFEHVSVAIGR